jgi:hypothetical protein
VARVVWRRIDKRNLFLRQQKKDKPKETRAMGGGFIYAIIIGSVVCTVVFLVCVVGCVLFACRGKLQTGPERTRSLLYGMCFM